MQATGDPTIRASCRWPRDRLYGLDRSVGRRRLDRIGSASAAALAASLPLHPQVSPICSPRMGANKKVRDCRTSAEAALIEILKLLAEALSGANVAPRAARAAVPRPPRGGHLGSGNGDALCALRKSRRGRHGRDRHVLTSPADQRQRRLQNACAGLFLFLLPGAHRAFSPLNFHVRLPDMKSSALPVAIMR